MSDLPERLREDSPCQHGGAIDFADTCVDCTEQVFKAADALAKAAGIWTGFWEESDIAEDADELKSLKRALAAYEKARGLK